MISVIPMKGITIIAALADTIKGIVWVAVIPASRFLAYISSQCTHVPYLG
jgi:hypothetical protein